MKIRAGYVSNSSSTSFYIPDFDSLPDIIQKKVFNYITECERFCLDRGLRIEFTEDGEKRIISDIDEFHFGFLPDTFSFTLRKDDRDLELSMDNPRFSMELWLDVWGINYIMSEDF